MEVSRKAKGALLRLAGQFPVVGITGPRQSGKTTLAKTLARAVDLSFGRIQFTPDTLPSDVLGVQILNMKTGEFEICRAGRSQCCSPEAEYFLP